MSYNNFQITTLINGLQEQISDLSASVSGITGIIGPVGEIGPMGPSVLNGAPGVVGQYGSPGPMVLQVALGLLVLMAVLVASGLMGLRDCKEILDYKAVRE